MQASPGRGLAVLFTITAFMGAALLFLVEPLVAKLLLPAYGGSATVWTTATLFFQVILLGGYIFVHRTVRLGPKRQPLLVGAIAVVALLVLPLALPSDAADHAATHPALWLLRTLLLMIGLPFVVLSTVSPLLQKWYSWLGGWRAEDPYFLYAASNVGSFLGLLAYPFAVEPHLSLSTQRICWSGAFLLFAGLVALCGALTLKRGHAEEVVKQERVKLSWQQQARWVLLAFLPSSLMLGVTTHITMDVAAIPLLWVAPLAIYLLTMVAAFASSERTTPRPLIVFAALVATAGVFLTIRPLDLNVVFQVSLSLFILFVVAYACHAQLAASRPEVASLTHFFVLVSLGGALGGLFNGILAPLLFTRPVEYSLVLAIVPAALLGIASRKQLVGAAVLTTMLVGAIGAVSVYLASTRDLQERTFYGSYAVETTDNARFFISGITNHGVQMLPEDEAQIPTTYYAKTGPLGQVMAYKHFKRVVGVGLGAGTVATYGQPGDTYDFIEIDPAVEKMAEDPKYFTFLSESKAKITTTVGDGRLEIGKLPASSQDLIILDAFSSDSIPVHLLTQEAMQGYVKKLAPGGSMLVHISNRNLDLVPVVAADAQKIGYRAVLGVGQPDAYAVEAYWVLVTPDAALADHFASQRGWSDISKLQGQAWTDDYSSLVSVLK